jgi:hypothetical protein
MEKAMSAAPIAIEEAMKQFPPIYVIYRKPKDFPDEVVMRVWFGLTPHVAFGFDDIEAARRTAHEMGACALLPRHPSDDPCIVESWI